MDDATGTPPPPDPGEPGLTPGAGAPLVPGPPRSVREPASARRLNTVLGTTGVLGIIAVVVAIVIIVVVIVSLFHR